MSKYHYSEMEQQLNNVLKHQQSELERIHFSTAATVNQQITESEDLLRSLGYGAELLHSTNASKQTDTRKVMVLPSWENMVAEAEIAVGNSCELEDIFSADELRSNEIAIRMMNQDYNMLHHLDKYDIAISALGGMLGAAVDILLVGIPQKTTDGLKAGPLSNYIRERFDKIFPQDEMEKLANSKVSKVPFDAQDNRNIPEDKRVEGLSAYYHRLLSLGHDPLLGFIFGIYDILNGTMTTIDKNGKFMCQVMDVYADRKEPDIFSAIAKQIIHFKSDITTSMGLPVPLMSLFNFLQFGNIGEAEQTIAEIVQGMYYEGYDFIHFCSMSIPTMIVEVVVRMGYAFKRIKEGKTLKEAIPFSLNREKHPKLETMLFIAHSGATAVNAGKIYFTKNPMAINYPQWIAFGKYSYKQLKWTLIEKPEARDKYVRGILNEELAEVYAQVDSTFEEFSKDYILVIEGA